MADGAESDSGSSLDSFGAALEAELAAELRGQAEAEEVDDDDASPRKRQRLNAPEGPPPETVSAAEPGA